MAQVRPPSRQKPPPEALHLFSEGDERRGRTLIINANRKGSMVRPMTSGSAMTSSKVSNANRKGSMVRLMTSGSAMTSSKVSNANRKGSMVRPMTSGSAMTSSKVSNANKKMI
jgi:hypothetical protein